MAVSSLDLPDIDLSSLPDAEQAKLNEYFQAVFDKLNELASAVTKEHP